MADPTQRYKDVRDFSASEHNQRFRDPAFRVETDEFIAARNAALQKAGLEDDHHPSDPESDPARMSVDDFRAYLKEHGR
jgi:hypothetical protein